MAKIAIAGEAIVITSTLTLENIRTLEKYRPKALVLKGGEDNKEDIFAIGTTNGTGNINEYGASFGKTTHDESKLACITLVFNSDQVAGGIKEYVADKVGGAVMKLTKLEEQLPAVLEEVAAEKAAIMDNIVIAG